MNKSILNNCNDWFNNHQQLLSWLLFLLSSFLILFGKYHHEMWLDEWQSVGIARSATSFSDLIYLRRYEGHPYLYFIVLYVWHLLAQSNTAIVVLHSVFALGAMYILLVKSSFPILVKLLFIFSIYFLWEFTVVNRVYAMCLFVIFLYTHLLHIRKSSFGLSILLVTVLCQLDAYSAALALLIGGYYFLSTSLSVFKKIFFIIAVLLNFLVLYVAIKQPSESTASYTNAFYFNSIDWLHFIRFFNYSFITHQNYNYQQWNQVFMFKDGIVFGIFVLILIAIFYTISNNKLRLAMAIAFVGLAYINLQIGANAVRHIGFYWIVFICSAWLNANNKKQKLLNYFLIVCLAVQSYWGLRMYTLDVHHPFSMAPKTVGYIKQYFASQKTFVGYGGMSISGPSAYLGMPIINIKSGVAQLYYNWNAQENITTSEIVHDNLERLNNIFLKNGSFVLIMNEDRQTNSFIKTLDSLAIHQANAIKKMPEFFGAIEPSENFYLYKMDNLIQGIPFLTIK